MSHTDPSTFAEPRSGSSRADTRSARHAHAQSQDDHGHDHAHDARPLFHSWHYQIVTTALFATQALIAVLVTYGWMWTAALLVAVAAHLMHGALIGFHEASHGLLRKNRFQNELDGVTIGLVSFVPFTLFRVIHQTHHAHLTGVKDEEFWPLVDPTVPVWQRRLAAFFELFFGLFYTPVIFLRAFLRKGTRIRNPRVRRRIWWEIIGSIITWTVISVTATIWHFWPHVIFVYLLPAFIAANLQSWRKYVEHVGLTGGSVNGITRNIVAPGFLGRLIDFSLLHETYHGVHHQNAGLAHPQLPSRAADLAPNNADDVPPFPNYWSAVRHLIPTLKNPHVGPQWRAER